MPDIEYRIIDASELDRLDEIDRTEVIEGIYYMRDGELVLEREHWDLKGWPPGHLEELKDHCRVHLGRGGTAWGAFDGDRLVGVASIDGIPIDSSDDTINMPLLHVSNGYRRQGIGTRLFDLAADRAREMGARRMYVSGMPSENSIHFYTRRGCHSTDHVDPELFQREPEDIHMTVDL